MSDCKWTGRNTPRIVTGRHTDGCADEACPGCAPCPRAHCPSCGREHTATVCADCIKDVRDNLEEIRTMAEALPDEVEHRGVESEAMHLLAPAADAEARGHLEASVAAGRVDASWLEVGNDDRHPLVTLGNAVMIAEDTLDISNHDPITVPNAVAWIDRHLHELGSAEFYDFADLKAHVRNCASHMRGVLHDQNLGDPANVGCFECGQQIERRLTELGFEDVWTCRGCRRRYTVAEYNFALRAEIEKRMAS